MAADLYQQRPRGNMLIVVPVVEQYRSGKPGIQLLSRALYHARQPEILKIFRHIAESSVIAAGYHHELRGVPAVYLRHRSGPAAVRRGYRVPVEVDYNLYRRVFLERGAYRNFAAVVRAGVRRVVVYRAVVQHGYPVFCELLCERVPDPGHVVVRVAGTERVFCVVVAALVRLVALCGVRVDYQHLRLLHVRRYHYVRLGLCGCGQLLGAVGGAVPHHSPAREVYVVVADVIAVVLPVYRTAPVPR